VERRTEKRRRVERTLEEEREGVNKPEEDYTNRGGVLGGEREREIGEKGCSLVRNAAEDAWERSGRSKRGELCRAREFK